MKRMLLTVLMVVGGLATPAMKAEDNAGGTGTTETRQVLIEAVVLETAQGRAQDLTFDFGRGTNGVNDPLKGFCHVAGPGTDWERLLQTLAKDRRVKILQRPRIQTSHAVPATLFVGQMVPKVTHSQLKTPGAASGEDQIQVGTTFEVTPWIEGEGVIRMDLHFRIDHIEGQMVIKDVGTVPVINSRETQTMVAVRDRDVILLGGLRPSSSQPAASALRFPKELPVPGQLASRSAARAKQAELLVMVRPTLLGGKHAGGA